MRWIVAASIVLIARLQSADGAQQQKLKNKTRSLFAGRLNGKNHPNYVKLWKDEEGRIHYLSNKTDDKGMTWTDSNVATVKGGQEQIFAVSPKVLRPEGTTAPERYGVY